MMTDERRKVLIKLGQRGPMRRGWLSTELSRSPDTIGCRLRWLRKYGYVESRKGLWQLTAKGATEL